MFKKLLGFGIFELTPFLDEDFTLDTANKVTITLDDQDAEDEATCEIGKEVETLIRASNRKEVYTKPNKKAGMMTVNVLNPIRNEILLRAFPDAELVVDGTDPDKVKVIINDVPGLVLSDWQYACKAVHMPVGANKQPLPAKFWTTYPRAVIIPQLKGSASAKPAKSKIDILSVGEEVVIIGDETATAAP